MAMGLLPTGTNEITDYDLQVIGHNASIVDNRYDGGTLLTRRLLLAVAHLQIRRDITELGDLLRRRAEADRSRAGNAYAIPNFIFWAIPILGFIGTVLGIGTAVAGLKGGFGGDTLKATDLAKTLEGVTGNLGVAFDTTLVALLMSMIAYLTQTLVKQQESQLLADVEDYLTYRLQSRIKTETSEDRMESIMRDALTEMTGIQQVLTVENQKNSRLTMQTMMNTQQTLKIAIEKFPEMLAQATETSAKVLEDTTKKGSQLLEQAATTGESMTEDMRKRMREMVKELGEEIHEAFAGVSRSLDAVVDTQSSMGQEVAKNIEEAGTTMAQTAGAAVEKLGDDFRHMGDELKKGAQSTVTSMSETIMNVGDEARMKVQAIGDEFLSKIAEQAEGLYANAGVEFQKTIAPLKEYLEQVVASLEKALEEGQKLVAVENTLSQNIKELSKAKKLDDALEGLRYTLVNIQPLLEKLKSPAPLRIDLGGVELPVSGARGF